MYVTLYPVEAFLSLLFYGPAGLISAWFTVLQQSGVISAFIVTFLLMPEIQKVAFDAVLSREYSDDVVLMAKLRRQNKVPFLARCGQVVWSLPAKLILPYTLLKTILLLIISAIPLIGPLLVIFIQAPTKGLQAHARYFSLKGYDQKQIKQIYKLNTGQYMGFGVVANFLESIPLLSVFFMFTNTVGAALWVIDIEKGQKSLYGINEHVDYLDLKAHDPLISQPLPEEPQDEIVDEDSKKEKEL